MFIVINHAKDSKNYKTKLKCASYTYTDYSWAHI